MLSDSPLDEDDSARKITSPQGLAELILENVNDAVIVINPQTFAIQYWNRAAERMYGWAAAEVLGRSIVTLLKVELPPGVTRADTLAALEHDGVWTGEVIQYHRDGRALAIDAAIRPLRDQRGVIVGLVGINRDVSERVRAREALMASEANLRAFFDSAEAAHYLLDMRYTILAFNRIAQRTIMATLQREIMVGDSALEYIAPANQEQFIIHYQRCLDGITSKYERYITYSSGATAWYEISYTPVRTSDGTIIGVAFSSLDMSARKQDATALWLRDRAIAALSVGILIADAQQPDIPIIYANQAVERVTGYPRDEIIGRNCRFLQGYETDPDTRAELRRAISAGRSCRVRILNYRKDGSTFWNDLTISPVRDSEGQITHYIGVQADVTDAVMIEMQLRQAQKLESIGRMAGGIAHDFNNILTAISGALSFAHELLPAEHPATVELDTISDATERAAALIRQLLAFARQQAIVSRTLDLNSLIQNLLPMLRRLIPSSVLLRVQLEPTPMLVRIDSVQIEQVLVNLVVNACDAMPNGGALMLVTGVLHLSEAERPPVLAMTAGSYVTVMASDTGTGMTPEVLTRAFEPFFSTKVSGTGLGLASCYGIISQHGGAIRLDSTPGIGTSAWIYLPRASATLQDTALD